MPEVPSVNMQLNVTGLDAAIRAAKSVTPGFTTAVLNDGLRQMGRAFVPSKGSGPLAQATPKVSGKLSRSTFFEIKQLGFIQQLVVKQPARTAPEYGSKFYGGFVRGGTKKHIIRPRLKSVLRFEIGGTAVFASEVNHPGTKPNKYHLRTLNILRPQLQAIVTRMISRLTEKFKLVKG